LQFPLKKDLLKPGHDGILNHLSGGLTANSAEVPQLLLFPVPWEELLPGCFKALTGIWSRPIREAGLYLSVLFRSWSSALAEKVLRQQQIGDAPGQAA